MTLRQTNGSRTNSLFSVVRGHNSSSVQIGFNSVPADIARSAQRTPTETWTVMGRFWGSKIASNPIRGSAFTVVHDPNVITKTELKACISTVKEASNSKGSPKGRFVLPDNCRFFASECSQSGIENAEKELGDENVIFGQHPRQIYVIWINRVVAGGLDKKFWGSPYKPKAGIDYKRLTNLKQDPSKDLDRRTETEITRLRINAARNCPRSSQDEVMDKVTANEVCNTP